MPTLKRYNGSAWETIGLPNDVGMSPQTLAYAQRTVTPDQSIITQTDLTDLIVTVTVPEGRRIRITGAVQVQQASAGIPILQIREGTTILQRDFINLAINEFAMLKAMVVVSPTAGTHTYKLSMESSGGAVNANYNPTTPAFILVEDITGSTLPYQPASVPVGALAWGKLPADQSIVGAQAAVNGCTLNVTVPAGRTLKISANCNLYNGVAGAAGDNQILFGNLFVDGVQRSGLAVSGAVKGAGAYGDHFVASGFVIDTPSAGAHTYELRAGAANGSVLVLSRADNNTYIVVEDITPTPAPATGAPSSTLAYAQTTTNQTGIGSTATDLTGLAVTVTVPAGRRIRVSGYVPQFSRTAGTSTFADLQIWEGAILVGTVIPMPNTYGGGSVEWVGSPSAGVHTYKLRANTDSGATMTLETQGGARPAYILVEDITGSTLPVGVSGLPSSTLAYDQMIANSTGFTTGETLLQDATRSLSVTVTLPAGRRLRVTGNVTFRSTVAGDSVKLMIKDATGNYLQERLFVIPNANTDFSADVELVTTPAVGAITYRLVAARISGTGTITVAAQTFKPSFILVEDITGVGVPGHFHPEITDTGWITPTMENGWINYDASAYAPCRYRRLGNIVYVTGLVKSGTANTTIFTLPVGFRPYRNLHLATVANAVFAILEIKGENGSPAGAVHHNTGSTVWFSVECSFMVG